MNAGDPQRDAVPSLQPTTGLDLPIVGHERTTRAVCEVPFLRGHAYRARIAVTLIDAHKIQGRQVQSFSPLPTHNFL